MKNQIKTILGKAGLRITRTNSSFEKRRKDIEIYKLDQQNPYFVSYPRTGSHWVRTILELYFDRPWLPNSFYNHTDKRFIFFHDHGMSLGFEPENVLYIYRDPVDTVFSNLSYFGLDNESIKNRNHVFEKTVEYGLHLIKWITTDTFTSKKTVLRYENIKSEPNRELKKAILHLGGGFDVELLKKCMERASKKEVQSNASYTNTVVANTTSEYIKQRVDFRENFSDFICKTMQNLFYSANNSENEFAEIFPNII